MHSECQILDDQLKELNENISTMTSSFESMLKLTLERMKLKITEANEQWKRENDSKLLEKFKEITEGGAI